MSVQRMFIGLVALLFLGIGAAAYLKKTRESKTEVVRVESRKEMAHATGREAASAPGKETGHVPKREIAHTPIVTKSEVENQQMSSKEQPDRIRRLFSKGMDKFPIVETITYTSRVPWLKGRPAWIADYATHFQTSRHFIARGLNGKPDYFTQMVSPGDKFNVFRTDKNFKFYLLVDLKTCTMDFYYLDYDTDERVFLKSYPIGVGRLDPLSPSGSLTPTGKYTLGPKVGIYKEGIEHYFQNQKREMIEVFGTRWMPFDQEIENCTDSATGYGIHGVPCVFDKEKGLLVEAENGVGNYGSDGCIRLRKDDIEELFSIVITKTTIVEIAKSKADVDLPMSKEVNE